MTFKLSHLLKGLVAHYPLDKESLQSATTFADKTPNENVGTKYGSVLKFDGVDDVVRIPDSESLSPTSAMTAMVWVKGTVEANKWILAKYDPATNDRSWAIETNHISPKDKVRVFISDNGTYTNKKLYRSSIVVFDNTWHLAGFTFDAGTLKLFVDGVEDTNITKENDDDLTTIHNSTSDITVGCYLNSDIPVTFFHGSLSGTKIWNRVLTPAEITTMYQGGVVDDTDLEAHWKFGDKSGAVLLDETVNNNDGTLTNFADTTAEYGNTHDSGWNTDDTPNVFALDRMGQSNRAMSFDGASDYVDMGDPSNGILDIGVDQDFTFSTYIKTADLGIDRTILAKRAAGNYYVFRVQSNGTLRFLWYDGTAGNVSGEITLDDNVWHNVVITRSGTTFTFYLDGSVDSSHTATMGDVSNTNSFEIGVYSSNMGYFPGSIADVRIYNRALSQQEITTLYEEYRPKLSMGSLMKGLVLDMPLNTKRYNAGNSKFDDLTPYENRGTNTGGDVDTDHTTFIAANSDNVRIPDSASLSPTNAMTAMVWVKGGAQQDKGCIGYWDYGANQRSYDIGTSFISAPYNKLIITISDNGTVGVGHLKIYESSIIAFDNTWHLIGFSFNAGTLKLFIDGVEDTDPTKIYDDAITTIHNSTADVMLGCYLNNDTPAGLFNGDMSGAKMWNRALSAEEWLLAYEKGR